MQRTLVTCAVIFGIVIVLVVAVIVIGGMYFSRPLPPIVIPPPPPLPADNGFDDCVRAASLLKDTDKLEKLDAAKQPREAEVLVKLNRPALDLVRKALPKDYMTPQVQRWDEEVIYPRGFRRIGRLFLAEGRLKVSAGDYSGALESFLDTRRFGAMIPRGGTLMYWLVGVGVSRQGYSGLESICQKLNASQCKYALKELQKADARQPSYVEMLEWDDARNLLMLKELQNSLTGKSGAGYRGPLIDRLFIGRGRSSVEDYQAYMRKHKAEAAKPFYRRQPIPEPKGMLTEMMTPIIGTLTASSETTTKGQLLKLMIALRSYSLEHGAYPESLAGLKSYGVDTMDEFSGKPLKYKRVGNGYLLYSVGPDGKDDGGAPLRNVNDKDVGDIVAGKLFPPKK